ncbi:antifreeze protein [Phaeospirillum tilakii]|uniref:Antifreeze protein n=1 Tax=Phaeospirillum tilakii TaxID=741673 RepID=A0ABW5C6S0_9PROT
MTISRADAGAGLLALALLLGPVAARAAEEAPGAAEGVFSVTAPRGAAPRFEARELGEPGLDGGGVLDDAHGGLGAAMWGGTDPAVIRRLLPRLPTTESPALRQLARRLLLTNAAAPAGAAPAGGPSLLDIRIDRLTALGESEGLAALVKAVPGSLNSPPLARARVETALLGGDVKAACVEAATRHYDEPRLKVVCALSEGRTLEANMALDLMRDHKEADPVFLLAAEAMAGVPPAKLERIDTLAPVSLAACRAGRLPLPPEAAATVPPGLLLAIATNPVNSADTRLAAAERAEALGLWATESLRHLYTDLSFNPTETQEALAQGPRTPRGRALLWRTIPAEDNPARRAQAIAGLLTGSANPAAFAAAARLYAPLLTALTPGPDLAAQAAPLARALVVIDRADLAGPWLNLAYGDPATLRQAKAVALLRRLARPNEEAAPIELPAADGLSPEAAGRRAEVILSLLEGVGEVVPPGPWLASLRDPLLSPTLSPRPALDSLAEAAATDRRLGETVLLSLVELGQTGFDRADPALLGRAVAMLRLVGLTNEARALAIEIALANGV